MNLLPRRSTLVCGTGLAGLILILSASFAGAQQLVTTHHYDNQRTGWNSQETALTPANVASGSFAQLMSVVLDDQVDAQPLVIPGVNITAGAYQGQHNTVYVVTENNSVYAIDSDTGVILLNPKFGPPVFKPLGCGNNGPNVGITSTPVIDMTTGTMYVMVYTRGATGPAYYLHALDIGSLTDKVTPQLVSASHQLTDGTTFNFNATYQRQRAALLLANGNIYAAFGSFCDITPSLSRGWLLGWTAGTLAPLTANNVLNTQPTAPNNFFLSSIWMSGNGPATDDSGNILFATGNSDPSGTTYDGVSNLQESAVKVSPDLTTVVDLFTPKNWAQLDAGDGDTASGGVMVLPDQPGTVPHLVVAAGKAGGMFLMNEDHLGGYDPLANHVLGTYTVAACWCGESYFVDPVDGLGRVISSGGRTARVWKLQITSKKTSLTRIVSSPSIGGGQDAGFFTTVSSNGTASPIIWAVSRPVSKTSTGINLFAFDPETGNTTTPMTQLLVASAGTWINYGGNANIVPVVANGKVFVASYKQLRIFGLH